MHDNRLKPTSDPFSLAQELSGKLLIDGALVSAQSGKTFANVNPATGVVIGQAAESTAADVDAAVRAVSRAQKKWAKMPARERGKLIAECGRVLNAHVDELGRLVALETKGHDRLSCPAFQRRAGLTSTRASWYGRCAARLGLGRACSMSTRVNGHRSPNKEQHSRPAN
jgi:acyl-CoA reductase-like NAD-dependent aldehyde dehydrogenase